ncbi:MAG: PRC-barrel domain-containing protein, partial [Thermoguttaceae bacterium]
MKRFCVVVGLVAIGSCVAALAADTAAVRQDAAVEGSKSAAQAGKLDAVTRGSNIRASQLIGMNIQNRQGK